MIWHLKDKGVRRPKDLPEHIERRLRFAVSRFGDHIQKVIVFLLDRNGPRGGIDKVCRILVKTRDCGVVLATVIDSEWTVAVDRATTRIGHTLGRQLDRRVDRQRGRHAPAARLAGPGFSPMLGAG
ncbi:MAG: HPF/RaiA family ribosome-associated protein [Planctomycetia bacterium]|nr:HPF/RaiA family ribosome-associated protein [Planctomycetia bacterium]